MPCGGSRTSPRTLPYCRLYFISFGIIRLIVESLKMEFCPCIRYVAHFITAYEESQKTETPIFLSVVCCLFPMAIFLTFIPIQTYTLVQPAPRFMENWIWGVHTQGDIWPSAFYCSSSLLLSLPRACHIS